MSVSAMRLIRVRRLSSSTGPAVKRALPWRDLSKSLNLLTCPPSLHLGCKKRLSRNAAHLNLRHSLNISGTFQDTYQVKQGLIFLNVLFVTLGHLYIHFKTLISIFSF